jgi:hypothetical protein
VWLVNNLTITALGAMRRYFFDSRDGDRYVRDDEGLELDGIEAARDEATLALRDLAKDSIPKSTRRELAIEVRDEADRRLIRASLWFEVQLLAT